MSGALTVIARARRGPASATLDGVTHRSPDNESVITDAALARAIAGRRAGEALAEEAELYARFAPRVRLFGLKHLRGQAAAEDLVQEVLLLTIERLRAGQVRDPDAIASFVLGTSRMLATSARRRERRRQDLLDRFGHLTAAAAPPAPAPAMRRVGSCLEELSDRDRSVLIMSFYAERGAEEIGRDLGLAAGAVRVARHRALERLRHCVGAEEVA